MSLNAECVHTALRASAAGGHREAYLPLTAQVRTVSELRTRLTPGADQAVC